MIGQVQLVNGVKTVVPVSGEVSTDSVTVNNMQSVSSNAVALALGGGNIKFLNNYELSLGNMGWTTSSGGGYHTHISFSAILGSYSKIISFYITYWGTIPCGDLVVESDYNGAELSIMCDRNLSGTGALIRLNFVYI